MFQYSFIFLLLFSVSLEARPKVGIVLSGGGARGAAHVGVLKALEEARIPVDYITGTSVGALVGALYAAGYSAQQLEHILSNMKWDHLLFNDSVSRDEMDFRNKNDHRRYVFDFELGVSMAGINLPTSLARAQNFNFFLQEKLLPVSHLRNFSKLPIPFQCIATDLETGNSVLLKDGNLANAVRASVAYPGVLSPIEIDGRLLADGGAADNLPVKAVRAMGADVVIAVDVASSLDDRKNLKNLFSITSQYINIFLMKSMRAEKESADFVVVPQLLSQDTFQFENLIPNFIAGKEVVEGIKKDLIQYSISEKSYEALRAKRLEKRKEKIVVDKIEVERFSNVDERSIRQLMTVREGEELQLEKLERDLARIYGTGDFERVNFDLTGEDARTLKIQASEKSWGPNYLRLHLSWEGEIKGKQDGNAVINWKMTRIGAFNAHWNSDMSLGTVLEYDSEFYQPIVYSGFIFVAPSFHVSRRDEDFYQGAARTGEYEKDSLRGQVDLGFSFRRFGELRAGVSRGFIDYEQEVGQSALPNFDVSTAAFIYQFTIDQLDSLYFPRAGYFLGATFYDSKKALGANQDYRKLSGQVHLFLPLSKVTLFSQFYGGTDLSSDLPVYDLFLTGGLWSFSGYRAEEIRAQTFGSLRIGVLWELPMRKQILWDRIFLSGWGEYGRFFREPLVGVETMDSLFSRSAGTFGIGFDTKIGSVFLAYGQSGTAHKQFYISVGRSFGIVSTLFK